MKFEFLCKKMKSSKIVRIEDDNDDNDDDDNVDDEFFLQNGLLRKAFNFISSWNHWQRFTPSQISNMLRAKFEPCIEPQSILCQMKFCSSDNHYITVPSKTLGLKA